MVRTWSQSWLLKVWQKDSSVGLHHVPSAGTGVEPSLRSRICGAPAVDIGGALVVPPSRILIDSHYFVMCPGRYRLRPGAYGFHFAAKFLSILGNLPKAPGSFFDCSEAPY